MLELKALCVCFDFVCFEFRFDFVCFDFRFDFVCFEFCLALRPRCPPFLISEEKRGEKKKKKKKKCF